MHNELLCLKMGGSVITNKKVPYTPRIETIKQIALAVKKVTKPMLIAHGSGSFGHTSAVLYGGKHGYKNIWGIAKVARDAMELNRIVMDTFVEVGLPAISFRPSSFISAENGECKKVFIQPLITALHQGLIPVIYGDVIWDTKWKSTIFSGEMLLNILCKKLQEKQFTIPTIYQFCDTDGVLDENGAVIPRINQTNWDEVRKKLVKDSRYDVTGGMEHKVMNALTIAQRNITTVITNGSKKQMVADALAGRRSGTMITAE